MLYDPIKDRLGRFFGRAPLLQRVFYRLLDILFLRSWYVRRELRNIFDELRDRDPVRVLDAGTGFGQYAYHVVRSYPSAVVTAVDIKEDYLEMARQFFARSRFAKRVSFRTDDLTALESKGPYDVILSVDVMEHIEDDEAVFRNFARVLAPAGYVVINTPSDKGGSGVEGEGDTSFIGEHVRSGYGMAEIAEKLNRAGLAPSKSIYTYGRFGSLAWKLSIRIPMLILSRSWLLGILLVPYFVVAVPVAALLNAVDTRVQNASGTGLLVVARKSGRERT